MTIINSNKRRAVEESGDRAHKTNRKMRDDSCRICYDHIRLHERSFDSPYCISTEGAIHARCLFRFVKTRGRCVCGNPLSGIPAYIQDEAVVLDAIQTDESNDIDDDSITTSSSSSSSYFSETEDSSNPNPDYFPLPGNYRFLNGYDFYQYLASYSVALAQHQQQELYYNDGLVYPLQDVNSSFPSSFPYSTSSATSTQTSEEDVR